MKRYQLFVRLQDGTEWCYVDTFQGASLAWEAMQLGRARGCQCKVTPQDALADAHPDVFERYVAGTKLSLQGMLAESAKLDHPQ